MLCCACRCAVSCERLVWPVCLTDGTVFKPPTNIIHLLLLFVLLLLTSPLSQSFNSCYQITPPPPAPLFFYSEQILFPPDNFTPNPSYHEILSILITSLIFYLISYLISSLLSSRLFSDLFFSHPFSHLISLM